MTPCATTPTRRCRREAASAQVLVAAVPGDSTQVVAARRAAARAAARPAAHRGCGELGRTAARAESRCRTAAARTAAPPRSGSSRCCWRSYRELPGFVRSPGRTGRWDQHFADELAGKRVLLVGAGDLAENTEAPVGAVRGHHHARRSPCPATASTASPTCTAPGGHDVALVMVPLTDETRGLVDARVPRRHARRRPAGQRRPRPSSTPTRCSPADGRSAARRPGRHRPRTAARGSTRSGRRPACCSPRTSAAACRSAGSGVPPSRPSRSRQFAEGNTPSNLVTGRVLIPSQRRCTAHDRAAHDLLPGVHQLRSTRSARAVPTPARTGDPLLERRHRHRPAASAPRHGGDGV